MKQPTQPGWLACALVLTMASCSGSIVDSAAPGPAPAGRPARSPDSPGVTAPALSPASPRPATADPTPTVPATGVVLDLPAIRRLTTLQIGNILSDVLGYTGARVAALPEVGRNAGYMDAGFLQSYLLLAEDVAAQMVARGDRLAGCAAAADAATCVRLQVSTLGERLFRRPLAADEVSAYLKMYDTLSASIGKAKAGAHVLGALLNSPHFLYLFESATRDRPQLSSLDIAVRLSLSLWNSVPDDELLAAAKASRLTGRDAVLSQASRMLQDPKARRMAADFFSSLLPFDQAATAARDPKRFSVTPELQKDFVAETRAFLDALVWQDGGTVADLYGAPYSYMNSRTAAFYGLKPPAGAVATTFARTMLPAQRAGILTHASMLTALAHPDEAAPVLRGVFVLRDLLCTTFPQPPPDVSLPDPPSSKASQRDRLARHVAVGSCHACHKLIDPVGLGMENYDAVGKFITSENGFALTGAGAITLDGRPVTFTGAVELGQLLSRSEQARRCLVTRMFEHMTGITSSAAIEPALADIDRQFHGDGGRLARLPLAIVSSPAFLTPRVPGGRP